jgi:predicted GNAT superfamily acetyltransferase
LDLAHFLAAGAKIVNSTHLNEAGWPHPPKDIFQLPADESDQPSFLLVEIPADFLGMKAADAKLALEWRLHTRTIFEDLFLSGYITTDFVFLPGTHPRSYYVLSRGESTLGD